MKSQIKKWGDSAAVRIPREIMKSANFSVNQAVNIEAAEGKIIIEREGHEKVRLDQLLEGITADNIHSEVKIDSQDDSVIIEKAATSKAGLKLPFSETALITGLSPHTAHADEIGDLEPS